MIKYVKGNILETNADVILHPVNCQGIMEGYLSSQIKKRYPIVYKYYIAMCDVDLEARERLGFSKSELLGLAQICYKEDYLTGQEEDTQVIVNCFVQDCFGRKGKYYTDYDALKKCFEYVYKRFNGKSLAIPYLMGNTIMRLPRQFCTGMQYEWERILNKLCEEKVEIWKE